MPASAGVAVPPARLNMDDGSAYAFARALAVPLLFKGEDLALTDVEAA